MKQGLIYVIFNKKDMSSVNTWITPAGTLFATISCLGNNKPDIGF